MMNHHVTAIAISTALGAALLIGCSSGDTTAESAASMSESELHWRCGCRANERARLLSDDEDDEDDGRAERRVSGRRCRCAVPDAGAPVPVVDAGAPPPAVDSGVRPPTTCTSFTYSAWGACVSGSQGRTVVSSSPAGCTGGSPVLTQACTVTPPPPTTCTSFTYSAWGACVSGSQTRTVVSSSPAGCTGGSPVVSQTCLDGAALYATYCAGCHGNSKKGSSASRIQSAINNNAGGMGSLRTLTAAEIAAIAAAP